MVKRRLLVCAAALMTGCSSFFFKSAEFREQEAYLRQTQPETFAEMRGTRNTGIGLQVIGGLLAGIGFVNFLATVIEPGTGEPAPTDEDVGAILLCTGGLLWLVGFGMESTYDPYVRDQGKRREGRLLIGPNGCALAYRF